MQSFLHRVHQLRNHKVIKQDPVFWNPMQPLHHSVYWNRHYYGIWCNLSIIRYMEIGIIITFQRFSKKYKANFVSSEKPEDQQHVRPFFLSFVLFCFVSFRFVSIRCVQFCFGVGVVVDPYFRRLVMTRRWRKCGRITLGIHRKCVRHARGISRVRPEYLRHTHQYNWYGQKQ